MTNLSPQLTDVDMQGNSMPNTEVPAETQPLKPLGQPSFDQLRKDTQHNYERDFYATLMAETLRVIANRDTYSIPLYTKHPSQ